MNLVRYFLLLTVLFVISACSNPSGGRSPVNTPDAVKASGGVEPRDDLPKESQSLAKAGGDIKTAAKPPFKAAADVASRPAPLKKPAPLPIKRVEDKIGVHTTPIGLRCSTARVISQTPMMMVNCANKTDRTHRVFVDVSAFGYGGIPTLKEIERGHLIDPGKTITVFTLKEILSPAVLKLLVRSKEVS